MDPKADDLGKRLPLPSSLSPMLASPGRPPDYDLDRWGVEMKWDGVRALAFCENGWTRLRSRTGKDITATYPELAGLGRPIGRLQALLDGEIVAFGADGRPDFEALQPRMHVSSGAQAARLAETVPVTFVAFDVLQLDGRPILTLPYASRRSLLEDLSLLSPPYFPGLDLEAVREASVAQGLEGVVAKRLDSVYEPGIRAASWLKIKNQRRQEVVVAGWKPGKGNREGLIGSLIVGVYSSLGQLVYCGHVGTGFTDKTLRMLTDLLRPLRVADCPFDGPVPPEYTRAAVWASPRLVVEVSFDRWTRAGRMRAPAYRGLRDDKDPADVVRET